MPAEWEPHVATWLAWPHHKEDWPGKFATVSWVYVEIVRHLHRSETVCILVQDSTLEQRVKRMLVRAEVDLTRVRFFQIRTNRSWTRDFGPIFVRRDGPRPEVAITDWKFNAWAKYPNWQNDDRVPARLARVLELRRWEATALIERRFEPVVLEGGSIDVNGQGTLLTTEECLLSPVQARNPRLTPRHLERMFRDYLGVRQVLWLGRGIAGDDTHGHIDDLARFVNASTVVAVREDNPLDENYQPLQENLERLRGMKDQNGKSIQVVPLPMPRPLYLDGQRLPASYANFYIANTVVLVPTFNDPSDRIALSILSDLFPDREVIGIHSVDLVWGLGTLHCLTQQQPL
ncbi:MAG: agmatine deiminase family protein [Acidobacteriota bacterium]